MSSRKFVLAALSTLMSVPLAAQTAVGTGIAPMVRGRPNPLDTLEAMLQRRNPTIDEVVMWSAEVARRAEEWERGRRELSAADEVRSRALEVELRRVSEEYFASQRLLARACALIRPHQGESEGVLGFQVVSGGTEFQRTTPLIKEERFVSTPEINFVEPNTPAAKSDVREGDIWVGIAGKDIVNMFVRDLNELLKPGARVELRMRREGRDMNVGVVAMKRREYPDAACNTSMFNLGSLPGAAERGRVEIYRAMPSRGAQEFFTMRITRATLAGALFVDLTDGKRDRLKVPAGEKGVVVESVRAGSPAEMAGLHELDVVLRANNEVIESAGDLLKVIQQGGPVTLWVWDGTEQRKVILSSR